jgi:hypothetical protein
MRRKGSAPRGEAGRTPAWRTRMLGLALTLAAHGLVLTALFWPRAAPPAPPVRPTLAPLEVSLLPTPQPPAPDKVEAPTDFAQPASPRLAAPVLAKIAIAPDNSDLLSESQLAGAASAGEGGGGGGGCDTAWRVQQALRRDPLVRAAVAGANRLGAAILLWNGDWVRSGGEDGKGLSAAREAITWEVAYAPEACRNQRMHGLVLLSLADGRTRMAIGSGDWRWSDLLGLRGTAPSR